MIIYNYAKDTKELINKEDARLDVLETQIQKKEVFLIPANSTIIEPLTPKANKINVWNGKKWELKEDYRGQMLYNTTTKEAKTIDKIGETSIQDGFTTLEPFSSSIWNGAKWVDDIENLKIIKKTEIETAKELEEFSNLSVKLQSGETILIQVDEKSQNYFMNKKTAFADAKKQGILDENTPFEWKAFDNIWHTLSNIDILMISLLLQQRNETLIKKASDLKILLSKAATKEEIESIQW
ncbi:MAG: hypothetical protein ACK5LP_00965 [Campylobacteraceae bacterium]